MGRYILNRLLWTVFILLGAAFVIFTILYFTPGDPAEMLLGMTATQDEIDNLRHVMGLDRSYMEQLLSFLESCFIKFDFGVSWTYGTPVVRELATRLPRTIILGLGAMVLHLIIGIPLGLYAGTHAGRWQDSLTMLIAMVLVSAPGFWVALMTILLFAQKLQWLPPYGIESWECYIMPILCSGIGGIASNTRQMRSSILEVIRADYITTARAKGQKESVVIRKHMLPNAMLPVITMIGSEFAHVVSGSPIMESVFSIPGVGSYLLTGISKRDYPIVRSCVLFLAAFTSIAMLATDLAYAAIDPRIKAQYSKRKKV